jgi:MFS family permease
MPSGVLPWIVWGLGAGLFCYNYFQRVAPSVMVADLMRDFAVTAATLGNLSAFYFYSYIAMQLPVGVLLDRFGSRRVLAIAAFVCGLGSVVFALAETLPEAQMGRLLTGTGAGFAFVGSLKLAANWFPTHRFALLSGLTMMVGMAGGLWGQAPLALTVAAWGWRSAMMVAGIAGLALALAIWLVVRDAPRNGDTPSAHTPPLPLLRGLALAVKEREAWLLSFVDLSMAAIVLAFVSLWSVPYLMQAYALDRAAAAGANSLALIGWAIGAPASGWLSDHIRRRKLPMLVAGVIVLVSFVALIYIPNLPFIGARLLLFMNGFASGAMIIAFAAVREHSLPSATGATIAFINMVMVGVGALMQPVIGWILDLRWDGAVADGARVYSVAAYREAFLTLVACGIISVIAAMFTRETYCRPVRG